MPLMPSSEISMQANSLDLKTLKRRIVAKMERERKKRGLSITFAQS